MGGKGFQFENWWHAASIVVLLWISMPAVQGQHSVGPDPRSRTIDAAFDIGVDNGEADDEPAADDDLLNMDLDQLSRADVVVTQMDTIVSTVSRTEVSVGRTPSAVYVITNEMIRRSGARNLMEVLRTAPGVHVARINASAWAISIRGFNGAYSDKLLVQVDGRAIYNPLFAGVFWNQQLVPLEDIERIEIVRGPGGTVWGANAVNGVINIVTKSSRDTVGAYAEAGVGTEHQSFSHGRVGGRLSRDATYRVYGLHVDDDNGFSQLGPVSDGRQLAQGGFRVDWTPTRYDTLTAQGDFRSGASADGSFDSVDNTGGNVLARWVRQVDCDTDWSAQLYYDHFKSAPGQTSPGANVIGVNIFDLDTQYHSVQGDHDLIGGFGFRENQSYIRSHPGQAISQNPSDQSFKTISYFLQDTITLADDELYLTLGCKCEHNDFVGFVYQPAVKLAWTPDQRTSIWGSVSRAVRTPSITNVYVSALAPIGGGNFLNSTGNPLINEEQAISYELGYRHQPTDEFYWEVSAFFTRYEDLIRGTIVDNTPPVFTATYFNLGQADTYGGEAWASYDLAEWCRLRGSYSLYFEQLNFGNVDTVNSYNFEGTYPRNMAYLGASVDLNCYTNLDVGLRYVDSLRAGEDQVFVPGYLVMDIRLACQLTEGLEASVVGQNLFDSAHPEFFEPTGFVPQTEVQSGVYGMLSWQY